MRVLVTRPASEAQGWIVSLRERGFDAIGLPLIEIAPAANSQPLVDAWGRLDACRAAMFVSGNAVRHFFAHRPAHVGAWPAATRAWATGAGTRQALAEAGVPQAQIDSPPADAAQFDSESLWRDVARQIAKDDCVLVVRGGDAGQDGDAGRDWLGEQLRSAGVQVRHVLAYVRAVPALSASQKEQALLGADQGAWLFSSSQAIANLQALMPGQSWERARAVATHPRIAQAARAASFGVVCESRPSVDAVAAALESFR